MKGSKLTGTLECWRFDEPVEVLTRLRVFPVPPGEGRGYEVDVLEATAEGQPFALTDAEVDRALQKLTEEA